MPGCDHMTAESVETWWGRAANVGRALAFCICCGGPAPAEFVELPGGNHFGWNVLCNKCRAQTAETTEEAKPLAGQAALL